MNGAINWRAKLASGEGPDVLLTYTRVTAVMQDLWNQNLLHTPNTKVFTVILIPRISYSPNHAAIFLLSVFDDVNSTSLPFSVIC